MQCSFGWDVTPSYPSVGLYKPIGLEAFDEASIQYVKFETKKQGPMEWRAAITLILVSDEMRPTAIGFTRFDRIQTV